MVKERNSLGRSKGENAGFREGERLRKKRKSLIQKVNINSLRIFVAVPKSARR